MTFFLSPILQVIGNATRCALSTSQLVACSKVVAPTIGNPMCQEQLIEASRLVAKSVEAVVQSSQLATNNENALNELGNAATAVTKALNDLLQHIKEKVSFDTPLHYITHHQPYFSSSSSSPRPSHPVSALRIRSWR